MVIPGTASPCAARSATSDANVGASGAATLKTLSRIPQISIMRRVPIASAMRPAPSEATASANVTASRVSPASAGETWNSWLICGRIGCVEYIAVNATEALKLMTMRLRSRRASRCASGASATAEWWPDDGEPENGFGGISFIRWAWANHVVVEVVAGGVIDDDHWERFEPEP